MIRIALAMLVAALVLCPAAWAAEPSPPPAPAPAAPAAGPELAAEDFDFTGGPLGSQGATIEKIARDHFKVTVGAAPNQPTWANNFQFRILRHARGAAPRFDVVFNHEKPVYTVHAYFHSWSTDGRTWHPVQWQPIAKEDVGKRATIVLPALPEDTAVFGLQVPLPYETLVDMIDTWAKHPAVKVHILGKSPDGRNLYRLEVTDPKSPMPPAERWVHYFGQQHPGEHNSRWRMVGMLEWLLSDEGADARRRSISHFAFLMSPDAPSKGWYRTNAAGVDMNRSYRAAGADPKAQTLEPYTFQKDLEAIMASPAPVTDIWTMHTWQGIVEPILTPGPEIGAAVGPWTDLREAIEKHDPKDLIKPLKADERYGGTSWSGGPHTQFGITAVLCEGAGNILTKEENVESGRSIMKGLSEYYKGTRPAKK